MSDWLDALVLLRERREAAVLVTVARVRGHAPREAGAKLVVSQSGAWGSIGGGNLEEVAVRQARRLLRDDVREPRSETHRLTDRVPAEHGVQCCGGEVELLFDPLPVRPAVAVFGIGHVGFELALLLARHDLDLHLVDSRADQLEPARLAPIVAGAPAAVRVHREPLLPELVVAHLPRGVHAVVMTHDHAEDLALVDALLRSDAPASIGLIGSRAKWARFRDRLADLGHDDATLARVRTPIGAPLGPTGSLPGAKRPAVLALAVAVDLLALAGGLPGSPAARPQRSEYVASETPT